MNIGRIHSLDYLRGLMACAVMLYHYSFWTFGEFDSATILGRLGLYGVSFFYILSGLTLYIVYKDYSLSANSLALFAVKRFFRIYPLLWLVTIIYVVALKITDVELLLLNFTGLFGFLKPEAYIGVGVWSIGNELVFYAFFPLLILSLHRFRSLFYISLAIIFLVGIYFGFFVLDSAKLLEQQWTNYINPFNQLYLFAGGILIGHLVDELGVTPIQFKYASYLMLGLTTAFCFYPAHGDVINIVTGWQRIAFSLICFLLCFMIYASEIKMKDSLHHFFSFIGATSYSIYLMHPIVFKLLKAANDAAIGMDLAWLFPISVAGTFLTSAVSYRYFEKPMIHIGAKLSSPLKRPHTS